LIAPIPTVPLSTACENGARSAVQRGPQRQVCQRAISASYCRVGPEVRSLAQDVRARHRSTLLVSQKRPLRRYFHSLLLRIVAQKREGTLQEAGVVPEPVARVGRLPKGGLERPVPPGGHVRRNQRIPLRIVRWSWRGRPVGGRCGRGSGRTRCHSTSVKSSRASKRKGEPSARPPRHVADVTRRVEVPATA
jgi:hypothetical protein